MALYINTNVPAINAQRALLRNNIDLERTFKRLSTGLRINSAKDDAAGLAISSRFTAQIRGLNQAIRNANDGISLAQTTEAAMNEMGGALQRIRELAVQAANDTNSASDRAALQAEADQHLAEIDRIATQTNFNGRLVLDGSFTKRVFQIGANAGDTLTVSIRGARVFNLGAEVNQTFAGAGTAMTDLDVRINNVPIRATNLTDDQVSTFNRNMSAIAKAAAINASSVETGVTATVEPNVVDAGAVGAHAALTGATAAFAINGVGIHTGGQAILANDSNGVLRNAINAVSDVTGVTASVGASNQLILTAVDGRNVQVTGTEATGGEAGDILGAGVGGFAGVTAYASIKLTSDDDIIIGASTGGTFANFSGTAAGTYPVNTAINLNTLSITTQGAASSAIGLVDTALRQVASQQAELGAILSRFESTVSSLSAVSENLSAARSRIQDADFAMETAAFTRAQILQQSSTSILAQANVAPQIALSLLQ
ncbi:MAG: flagellin [Myxococcales bacterium]|nr:flagellin [Myxococcales bacterium]